jgi:hypothetical protein
MRKAPLPLLSQPAADQYCRPYALCLRSAPGKRGPLRTRFRPPGKIKAEKNSIVTIWQQVGLDVQNAGDSQALIQLKKEYCDKKDCLRCRIGYEYLKKNY